MNLYKSKSQQFMLLLCLVLLGMSILVNSDITKDREECQNQLVAMSSCLSYVGRDADETPPPECCMVLHDKLNSTKKCLCILVKDRDDPNLGINLNATRALGLPSICHLPSNPLECIDLLGLSTQSPEAQIFIQTANKTQGGGGGHGPVDIRNDGGKRRCINMQIIANFILWFLVLISAAIV